MSVSCACSCGCRMNCWRVSVWKHARRRSSNKASELAQQRYCCVDHDRAGHQDQPDDVEREKRLAGLTSVSRQNATLEPTTPGDAYDQALPHVVTNASSAMTA